MMISGGRISRYLRKPPLLQRPGIWAQAAVGGGQPPTLPLGELVQLHCPLRKVVPASNMSPLDATEHTLMLKAL